MPMNAVQIMAAVNRLCDARQVPPVPNPIRMRMLAIGVEARRRGKDPADAIEKALSLMFDAFEGPVDATPASPVAPKIHSPHVRRAIAEKGGLEI